MCGHRLNKLKSNNDIPGLWDWGNINSINRVFIRYM